MNIIFNYNGFLKKKKLRKYYSSKFSTYLIIIMDKTCKRTIYEKWKPF